LWVAWPPAGLECLHGLLDVDRRVFTRAALVFRRMTAVACP
jgi:hypothetical protein